MRKYEWKCINKDGETKLVSVWATTFKVAEEEVCKYCNEVDLTPLEYLGYTDNTKKGGE